MLEEKAREKKSMFEGQLSLFDIAGEEDRNEFQNYISGCGGILKG